MDRGNEDKETPERLTHPRRIEDPSLARISFIDQLPVAPHDRSCGRADPILHG
jgi:hypothetical protein